jgi:hypothetical protein
MTNESGDFERKPSEPLDDTFGPEEDEILDLDEIAGSPEADLEHASEEESITDIRVQNQYQLWQARNERNAHLGMQRLLFYTVYFLSLFVFLSTLGFLGLKILKNHDLNDAEKAALGGVLGVLAFGMRTVLNFYFNTRPKSDGREGQGKDGGDAK